MVIIIDPFLRPSLSLLVEVAFFSSELEATFSGDTKKRGMKTVNPLQDAVNCHIQMQI
jgi:hypothetical protein